MLWSDITPEILRSYLIYLESKRPAQGGIHAYYRAVRAFSRWAWEEYEFMTRCPIDKVKSHNRMPNPIPGIPVDEVNKIMVVAKLTGYPESDRCFGDCISSLRYRNYGFHTFRRCFALERKRNGDDDITISRALGHSSLKGTKRYLAFSPEDDRNFVLPNGITGGAIIHCKASTRTTKTQV